MFFPGTVRKTLVAFWNTTIDLVRLDDPLPFQKDLLLPHLVNQTRHHVQQVDLPQPGINQLILPFNPGVNSFGNVGACS